MMKQGWIRERPFITAQQMIEASHRRPVLGNSMGPDAGEVGDRWAPGLDSWCLPSGVKLKLCSHLDTPRTKLVYSAGIKREDNHPWGQEKLPSFHVCRKTPWESKREKMPLHNTCGHAPTGLCTRIYINNSSAGILGRITGQIRCEKRNRIIGQR